MQRCVAFHLFCFFTYCNFVILSWTWLMESWIRWDFVVPRNITFRFPLSRGLLHIVIIFHFLTMPSNAHMIWFFFRSEHMTLAPIVESIGSVEASSSEHMLFAVDTLRTDCIEFLLGRCAGGSFVIEKRIRIALPLLCEHRLEANTLWEEERYSSKNNRSY